MRTWTVLKWLALSRCVVLSNEDNTKVVNRRQGKWVGREN